MKISKRELRQIIKEEKSRLLNEGTHGHAIGLGFEGWSANRTPNFAKAYGQDARVIGQYRNNNADLKEQPMPAPTSDPVEAAYQELKYSGAYKDFQESLHDSLVDLEGLFDKHSDMLLQADQGSILDDLQELQAQIDNLRSTFSALR